MFLQKQTKWIFVRYVMTEKPNYRTKQKSELLDYMKSVQGEHVTAQDACDYLRRKGVSIGQTTVYRQLERMVDEGLVNKYVLDANTPACFEYVPEDSHVKCGVCFHCKCEKCGKLFHVSCETLSGLAAHLMKDHGFEMDPLRTVFYGVCKACRA
jgi:Fur family ferric uptake transcriptional regulator